MLTGSLATLNADRADRRTSGRPRRFRADESDRSKSTSRSRAARRTKLLIGSDTPAGTGTYAKLEGDPKVYTVPIFTKSEFRQDGQRSARQAAADVQSGQADRGRAHAAKGPTVEFGKNAQGDWQITKPKPMRADSLQVDDLIRKLKDAKMDLTSPTAMRKPPPRSSRRATRSATASTTDNTARRPSRSARARDNALLREEHGRRRDLQDRRRPRRQHGQERRRFPQQEALRFRLQRSDEVEINGTAYQKTGDKWTSGSDAVRCRQRPDRDRQAARPERDEVRR